MDLHVDLERAAGATLRARLENALRDGVRSGLLAPGTRLPASRALSAQLGVSRGVVVDAYAQLSAEGYLHARQGSGTTVAATGAWRTPTTAAAPAGPPIRHDLSPFVPALDCFPRAAWRSALNRALRSAPDERLGLPPAAGVPELRAALAGYLSRSRGVRAVAGQVIVCNGLRQGLGLLWGALAAGGAQRVAVEDPAWDGIAQTARDARLGVVEIPVDEDGLVVARLAAARYRIDAVAVAPAHQYPTGAVMAPARREALVAWAQEHGALVFEDDYDAEYRYDRAPIGSIQGLAPEHVAYGGSASKSLAPGMRLAWLVVPPRLLEPMTELQARRGGMPAALDQLALADLVERGELDRHLRRQRRRYRRQRDALLAALAARIPDVAVRGAAAGLFVVLRLPPGVDAEAVVRHARAVGLAIEPGGGSPPAVVVGYGNLAEAAIGAAVDALAASVRAARPSA
ncbi:MAG: PLP-dependent aminotransferase family protein [Thermoleophilia bacterium]